MTQGVCEVCNQNASKYKCPVCQIKFCCVACFKTHKTSNTCIKPEPAKVEFPTDKEQVCEYDTEDTVKPEILNLLGLDKHVREDLQNPYLRDLLKHLNSSQDPDTSIQKAMQEPLFSEFVTHCLNVVEH